MSCDGRNFDFQVPRPRVEVSFTDTCHARERFREGKASAVPQSSPLSHERGMVRVRESFRAKVYKHKIGIAEAMPSRGSSTLRDFRRVGCNFRNSRKQIRLS